MSKPKFAIGDVVDVRHAEFSISGTPVTKIKLIQDSSQATLRSLRSNRPAIPLPGYWYGVDGKVCHESVIFPHYKPSDDSFDEMMRSFNSADTVVLA